MKPGEKIVVHSLCFLFLTSVCVASALPCRAQQPVLLTTKLMAPISTKTSNVGDKFTAIVTMPQPYATQILEGRITKLKAPERGIGKGKPELIFQFETITANGVTIPINAELTGFANSKGVRNVDEEGRVIGKTSNAKRLIWTAIGAAAGAGVGAATAGAKGAASGAAIGGAGALLISLTMTTTGSDIEFAPGSELVLQVRDRRR